MIAIEDTQGFDPSESAQMLFEPLQIQYADALQVQLANMARHAIRIGYNACTPLLHLMITEAEPTEMVFLRGNNPRS